MVYRLIKLLRNNISGHIVHQNNDIQLQCFVKKKKKKEKENLNNVKIYIQQKMPNPSLVYFNMYSTVKH